LLQDDRPRLLYIRGADVAETELEPRTFESLVGQSGRYRPEGGGLPSAFSWVRLIVPLKVRQKTTGLWLLGRRDPDDYYPRGDIDSLTWMAGQVALAVENSRLYAESIRQTQELGGLYQTARAFGSVMDKQTLLSWVHDEVSRLMVLDRFMVILYDVERERFHVAFAREAGHPIAVSQAGDLPLSGAEFAQRVLNTSRTVLVRDAESAEPEPGWSDDRPARSWLGVPLLARERTVGLICVQSFREEAFDDANAHFLEALAGQLATALDNAQLFEETSRRAAHLETVVRFGSALRGASNRMAMLGIILDQLQVLLGMEAVAAALLDPATGGWSLEMTRGGWHPMASLRIRGDLGAIGSLLAAGATFSTDDVATDPRIEHPEAFGGMTAAAVVPLLAERETVGAVAVGRRRAIAREDIRLLTAIMEMAGNALRRAGVMDTLEQRVEERTHELEAANERLKELDALKTDFVSNVSHELRSPITNIVLYLDLLARPFPEEKRASFLVVLMREALRLGRLIEDLLSLSRMDRDATPAKLESHDLDGLLTEVLVAHHARAVDKGIELNHEPSLNGSPAWIAREQMGQGFHNLMANALAYTPSGGHVSVRILTGGTGEAPLVGVRIHNDGPAIPAEDIPHLFERFFRGKTGRASGESGSGLGLAICQEIVLRHRGWIEVASSEAQGTAFTVWLPSGVEPRPA
jgi:signal transduction histidine kinase